MKEAHCPRGFGHPKCEECLKTELPGEDMGILVC